MILPGVFALLALLVFFGSSRIFGAGAGVPASSGPSRDRGGAAEQGGDRREIVNVNLNGFHREGTRRRSERTNGPRCAWRPFAVPSRSFAFLRVEGR